MKVTIGQIIELTQELPVECCRWTLPIGSRVKVLRITSPNRSFVDTLYRPDFPMQSGGVHRVKISKIRYNQEQIEGKVI